MTGFAPAATFLRPSLTMIWARTVAVVVPSPATSLVLVATSFTSWAPWFSKMSSSSISRAMVTPSLVMVGEPNFLSSTTYWPFGPRVILTASASLLTPASRALLASELNLSSLCASICLAGLQFKHEHPKHLSYRQDTEPEPSAQGAGP